MGEQVSFKILFKSVLFLCLLFYVTSAAFKQRGFRRYPVELEGCDITTKHRQSVISSSVTCQSDDNCSAVQYNPLTSEYETCDRNKISSLKLDGTFCWVKRTRTDQDLTKAKGTTEVEIYGEPSLQVGMLIYASFTFLKEDLVSDIVLECMANSRDAALKVVMDGFTNRIFLYTFVNRTIEELFSRNMTFVKGEKSSVFVLLTADNFVVMVNGQHMPVYKYFIPITYVRFYANNFAKVHELSF